MVYLIVFYKRNHRENAKTGRGTDFLNRRLRFCGRGAAVFLPETVLLWLRHGEQHED